MLRWSALLVLPLLPLVPSVAFGEEAAEPRPASVATRRFVPAPHTLTLPEKVGVMEAALHRSMAFQVQGRLEYVAGEGSELKAGERIAVLDSELQRVGVRRAEIRLADARSETKRVRGLRASGAASEKLLESVETALALREADLAAAREELERRALLAPFDGVVAENRYERHEIVPPGGLVVFFQQAAILEIEVELPGYQIVDVEPDARAIVAVPALGGSPLEGRVVRVAPSPKEGSHLFPVTVSLQNPGLRMRPGMLARVRIVTLELDSAVVAPVGVAVARGGQRTVYFVVDGRVRAVDAGQAAIEGDRIVLTGPFPSHEIVVRGHHDLRDGGPVQKNDAILAGLGERRPEQQIEIRGPQP